MTVKRGVAVRRPLPDVVADIAAAVDSTPDGCCARPQCGRLLTADTQSTWFCSVSCQEEWQFHHNGMTTVARSDETEAIWRTVWAIPADVERQVSDLIWAQYPRLTTYMFWSWALSHDKYVSAVAAAGANTDPAAREQALCAVLDLYNTMQEPLPPAVMGSPQGPCPGPDLGLDLTQAAQAYLTVVEREQRSSLVNALAVALDVPLQQVIQTYGSDPAAPNYHTHIAVDPACLEPGCPEPLMYGCNRGHPEYGLRSGDFVHHRHVHMGPFATAGIFMIPDGVDLTPPPPARAPRGRLLGRVAAVVRRLLTRKKLLP